MSLINVFWFPVHVAAKNMIRTSGQQFDYFW
jgi:hypothetical protein